MNVTLLAAILLLVAWILLVFVVQIPSGTVHLLYAGAVILFARRVLIGAPTFRS
ncbi:MAG: hypothetical protein ACREME_10965 [Gemmatimonadales bacterium]